MHYKVSLYFLHPEKRDVRRLLKLRKYITSHNRGGGIIRLIRYLAKIQYNHICFRNQCFIPLSAEIGYGVVFPHGLYGILISQGAIIGENCTIFHQVTIGSNTLKDSKGRGSPTIGNNVYIGAGAKSIGNVYVGDNARIGSNAVVVKDLPANSTAVLSDTVVIPHKNIRDNDFERFVR